MLTALLIPLMFSEFEPRVWTEAEAPPQTPAVHDIRTMLSIHQELTLDRNMPAGRVRGSQAILYWSEQLIESPYLTCLELPTGKVLWQQPAAADWNMLLFTKLHVIAVRQKDHAGLSLRWYELQTGVPDLELECPGHRGIHLLDQRWLVFPNGEIRHAETGEQTGIAQLQQIENILTRADTAVCLEIAPSSLDYDRMLHKFELTTGKTIAHYKLNEYAPQDYLRLIAMDDRRVFLETQSFDEQTRAALCFDIDAGGVVWKTPVPQWAALRIVSDNDPSLTRRPSGGNLATFASLDLNATTGAIQFPLDRPSPLSRFDWYLPPRTAALAMRWADTRLVGWFSTGDKSTLIRVDPRTGQRDWQVAVSYPHPSMRWLPELGNEPLFALFLGGENDVQIVDLASGTTSSVSRSTLAFPPALPAASPITPVTDDLLNPTEQKEPVLSRIVILCLSGGVFLAFLLSRFRPSR